MANQPLNGTARLKAALVNSLRGAGDIWKNEEAFRMECWILAASVPLALWLSDSATKAAFLVGAGILVLIVEVLNSAIEATIDRIGTERHELSRIAKDAGSFAVFLAMSLWGLIWLAAFYDAWFG